MSIPLGSLSFPSSTTSRSIRQLVTAVAASERSTGGRTAEANSVTDTLHCCLQSPSIRQLVTAASASERSAGGRTAEANSVANALHSDAAGPPRLGRLCPLSR
ncbi:hypothetical protein B296_00054408, partial [Ensete ventricosum]